MSKIHRLKVAKEEKGQTLLAFLRANLSDYPSVKAIKKAIDEKKCKINGRVEWFSTYHVQTGDQIEIVLASKIIIFPLTILHEDEELIVFNKPPGKTSESFDKFFLVHRLDKDTSGAFLVAKTEAMQAKLLPLFSKREIEKNYICICDGKITEDSWNIDNYLGKIASYQGGSLYGRVPKDKGKHAVTFFKVLKRGDKATLVLAQPITGRTHQIRVHLKEKGNPILGDWQYARQFRCPYHPPRHMLHALSLQFTHPTTHEKLEIKAPLFPDFIEAQNTLFGD